MGKTKLIKPHLSSDQLSHCMLGIQCIDISMSSALFYLCLKSVPSSLLSQFYSELLLLYFRYGLSLSTKGLSVENLVIRIAMMERCWHLRKVVPSVR
jgi:hypothetical protein